MKQTYLTRWLLTALILLVAVNAAGQTLTVTAPAESLAGDLVVLQIGTRDEGLGARYSETLVPSPYPLAPSSDPSPWPLAPSFAWTVTPPELVEGKYRVCDGGRTVVFASRLPGTYFFTAAAVIDGKPVVVTHRLDLIGVRGEGRGTSLPQPSPTPNPEPLPPDPVPIPPSPLPPGPSPLPDVDAEISALQQFAAQKATELVKSQYFDREKKALSEAFLASAKYIEQEGMRDEGLGVRGKRILAPSPYSLTPSSLTPEQARVKQRENSRAYLSSVNRNSWQTWSEWDAAVAKRLAEINEQHVLTVEQIGRAYKQIGLGLQ